MQKSGFGILMLITTLTSGKGSGKGSAMGSGKHKVRPLSIKHLISDMYTNKDNTVFHWTSRAQLFKASLA